jgi:hypothetical protein
MIGLVDALIASTVGGFGPAMVWRGATLLGIVMISAGLLATANAAENAQTAGLHFGVSLGSALFGLADQAAFVSLFYATGVSVRVIGRAIARRVRGNGHRPA